MGEASMEGVSSYAVAGLVCVANLVVLPALIWVLDRTVGKWLRRCRIR
jgi:hypothetical protein